MPMLPRTQSDVRRRVAHARALLLLASWGALACNRSGAAESTSSSADSTVAAAFADSTPSSTLALPVVAEPARDGDLVLRVTTTGQVRSDAAVKLRADIAGRVATVRVRPGTRVSKGDVLLTLDPYPFELAVREAKATPTKRSNATSRAMSPSRSSPDAAPRRSSARRS